MTLVPPGKFLGIVGGGQLGRMLALEGKRLGYRAIILDPDPAGPAAQVADRVIQAELDDAAAILELARACSVLTFETEHIPAAALAAAAEITPVFPAPSVLEVVQDRLRQKEMLRGLGLPQARFAPVHDVASAHEAVRALGLPAVLKLTRGGYDGRGQVRVMPGDDIVARWSELGSGAAVLEELVTFTREVSVVLGRDAAGQVQVYPVAENRHEAHILSVTNVPARISAACETSAVDLATKLANAFSYVGVMTVEMFVLPDERLLVNEIAPRVHNSGHFTWGACVTSQFEQHVRALCGLPLGSPALLAPVAMVNLLGDLWRDGEPAWERALAHPGARLHLYGKAVARPGRKMGHVLVFEPDAERAARVAVEVLRALER